MTAQESSELAEFVKEQVLELFDWKVVGVDAAHVRQMGSYLRGKQRCSVTLLASCFLTSKQHVHFRYQIYLCFYLHRGSPFGACG